MAKSLSGNSADGFVFPDVLYPASFFISWYLKLRNQHSIMILSFSIHALADTVFFYKVNILPTCKPTVLIPIQNLWLNIFLNLNILTIPVSLRVVVIPLQQIIQRLCQSSRWDRIRSVYDGIPKKTRTYFGLLYSLLTIDRDIHSIHITTRFTPSNKISFFEMASPHDPFWHALLVPCFPRNTYPFDFLCVCPANTKKYCSGILSPGRGADWVGYHCRPQKYWYLSCPLNTRLRDLVWIFI